MFYLISDGIRIGLDTRKFIEYLVSNIYRIIKLTFCGCVFNMLFHLFLFDLNINLFAIQFSRNIFISI